MSDDLGPASPAQRTVTHDPSHHGDGDAAGGPLVGRHGHRRIRWLAGLSRRLWGWINPPGPRYVRDDPFVRDEHAPFADSHTIAAAGGDLGNGDAPTNQGTPSDRSSSADLPSVVRPGSYLLCANPDPNGPTSTTGGDTQAASYLRAIPDRRLPANRPRHPLAPCGGYVVMPEETL